MKKKQSVLILGTILALSTLNPQILKGQALEMNGFTGYHIGGSAWLYDGEFRIDNAMNYGGRFSVGLSTTTYAEITYLRTDTEGDYLPFIGTGATPVRNIAFSGNYILVSGLQEVHFGPVSPFATLGVGLAIWSPKKDPRYSLNSKTQFSAMLGGGVKIWLTDFLGIRLQGSMLMPMVYNGFGFGCGISSSGSNCGSSVYTRVTPFQGEFTGGIILKLMPN